MQLVYVHPIFVVIIISVSGVYSHGEWLRVSFVVTRIFDYLWFLV